MEDYVYAPKDTWREVYDVLKERDGLSLKRIKSCIGVDFSHAVYQGYGIPLSAFRRLQELLGTPIPAEVRPLHREVEISHCDELAEFVGIVLGDGSISERMVQITIGIRRGDEYLSYVRNLVHSLFHGLHIGEYRKDGAVDVKIYSVSLVNWLRSSGCHPGDKKRNQIGVPEWVEADGYSVPCVRGLIDTDGTVYRGSRDGNIVVELKNDSQPILDFFVHFCEGLDIRVRRYRRHCAIYRQEDVKRFLKEVRPFKLRLPRPSPSLCRSEVVDFLHGSQ